MPGRLGALSVDRFANIADWASVIGMVVSILGLCLTLCVWIRVRRIEEHYVRQALLPNYLRKLGGQLKNLREALDAKNRELAREALTACQWIIEDLLPFLAKTRRQRIQEVVKEVDAVCRSSLDATYIARCQRLAGDLKALLDSLKSFEKETHWRMRDGR